MKYTSTRKFIQIMKIVLTKPGMTHKSICQISGLNKSDVSRLLLVGINEGLLSQKDNHYMEGEFFREWENSLLGLMN